MKINCVNFVNQVVEMMKILKLHEFIFFEVDNQ